MQKNYKAQVENQYIYVEDLFISYVLRISLSKTIDQLYAKKKYFPKYVEIFKDIIPKKNFEQYINIISS